jgi:hypothetical protein
MLIKTDRMQAGSGAALRWMQRCRCDQAAAINR